MLSRGTAIGGQAPLVIDLAFFLQITSRRLKVRRYHNPFSFLKIQRFFQHLKDLFSYTRILSWHLLNSLKNKKFHLVSQQYTCFCTWRIFSWKEVLCFTHAFALLQLFKPKCRSLGLCCYKAPHVRLLSFCLMSRLKISVAWNCSPQKSQWWHTDALNKKSSHFQKTRHVQLRRLVVLCLFSCVLYLALGNKIPVFYPQLLIIFFFLCIWSPEVLNIRACSGCAFINTQKLRKNYCIINKVRFLAFVLFGNFLRSILWMIETKVSDNFQS